VRGRRVRIVPGAILREIGDGGLVVLSPEGTVYRGNAGAGATWRAIQAASGDLDLAAADIAERCSISVDRVRSDLDHLVAVMSAAGIVRAEP
jgi:hypothetical protein